MAEERGWWELVSSVELSDSDKQHIGKMIAEGYSSGEVVEDED